jgi:predicted Zn-dependent peptidase
VTAARVARVARATAPGATADPSRQPLTVTETEHQHQITTLPSGVRVVTERMPSVRSVALGFWIGAGSVIESGEQAGISHLLEHMLFRGTERYGSQEIDEIFDAMGAECNAGTDKESTSLYTRTLDRHLEKAFDVMADMVWRPRFGELEAEREVVLEEIAMYEDDPQDKVFDVLGGAVYDTHPLGQAVIGRAEVVAATTRAQLSAFHAARYTPGRIVISAAGSVDHDALVAMAAAADPGGEDAPATALPAPSFQPRVRFERKDTEQYHLCLGGPGLARDDERRFTLRVLDTVLGGASSSRLFQEVRERRGLAYSVFSFANLHAHSGDVGLYVGTRPENLAEAVGVLARELERFASEPATAQELDRSRENAKGRMALSLESTGARMSRLGGSLLNDLPILSFEEIMQRLDAVNLEDMGALAGELFAPARLAAAAIGPDEKTFHEALAPLQTGLMPLESAPSRG